MYMITSGGRKVYREKRPVVWWSRTGEKPLLIGCSPLMPSLSCLSCTRDSPQGLGCAKQRAPLQLQQGSEHPEMGVLPGEVHDS